MSELVFFKDNDAALISYTFSYSIKFMRSYSALLASCCVQHYTVQHCKTANAAIYFPLWAVRIDCAMSKAGLEQADGVEPQCGFTQHEEEGAT